MADKHQAAVDANYEAFKEKLQELLQSNPGKFALLRDGEIVEFFDTARDAMIHAQKNYEDGMFSVQQITNTVVDLGYFSHAVPHSSV